MEMIIIIIIIMKEKECVKILIMTCVERSNEPSYTGLHAHVVPCCHARSDHLGNHILVVLFKVCIFITLTICIQVACSYAIEVNAVMIDFYLPFSFLDFNLLFSFLDFNLLFSFLDYVHNSVLFYFILQVNTFIILSTQDMFYKYYLRSKT